MCFFCPVPFSACLPFTFLKHTRNIFYLSVFQRPYYSVAIFKHFKGDLHQRDHYQAKLHVLRDVFAISKQRERGKAQAHKSEFGTLGALKDRNAPSPPTCLTCNSLFFFWSPALSASSASSRVLVSLISRSLLTGHTGGERE